MPLPLDRVEVRREFCGDGCDFQFVAEYEWAVMRSGFDPVSFHVPSVLAWQLDALLDVENK
jgi:hypothetical protein